MNVTPYFVFVHIPKTGGTFVSECLGQMYGDRYHSNTRVGRMMWMLKRLRYRLLRRPLLHDEFNQHGSCRDIPSDLAHLPILSCMRNPLDWYVSNYKFAFWEQFPEKHPKLLQDPRWPNLSFSDYLELSGTTWLQMHNPDIEVNRSIGRLTVLFVNFFCQHPEEILSLPADTPNMADRIRRDMFPVNFLETGNLNQELYTYLTQFYPEEEIAFIRNMPKISPRNLRSEDEKWAKFYTPQLMDEVISRDRCLFELFPRYKPAGLTE